MIILTPLDIFSYLGYDVGLAILIASSFGVLWKVLKMLF